jgi:hypothetical protein
MKIPIIAALLPLCVLAFAPVAQAQQAPPAPREHSMTGCLKQGTEAGTFLVTDVEGTGPASIGIVSSTANLAPHVGHKIEVTGTAVPAADAEKDAKVPKAPHYMRLTAIRMISATCP